MSKTHDRTDKAQDDDQTDDVHTEVRPQSKNAPDGAPLKPRTPREKLPGGVEDDGDDDLFNDLPV